MFDAFSRRIDYLRISITDRCNERCLYCLPEGFNGWTQRENALSYEELREIVAVAVAMGFSKFRVTGGEPLVRRDAADFVCELLRAPGVEHVGLSTNGTRLAPVAGKLARAGLHSVNISLDALDAEKYHRITGGNIVDVMAGIEAARDAGIPGIKLNTVLMRGINEDEILPLIEFAARKNVLLRFIELMPVSRSEMLSDENFFPIAEAKRLIESETEIVRSLATFGHGPAVYYELPKLCTTVGFIGAMTDQQFCGACNKMRLTVDGTIRPCLGQHGEIDLKPALRPAIDAHLLQELFLSALRSKPQEHAFRDQYEPGRIMTAIGG